MDKKYDSISDEWFLKGDNDIKNRRFEIAIFPRVTRKRADTF